MCYNALHGRYELETDKPIKY